MGLRALFAEDEGAEGGGRLVAGGGGLGFGEVARVGAGDFVAGVVEGGSGGSADAGDADPVASGA